MHGVFLDILDFENKIVARLGVVVVMASDLWSRDREFSSRPVHCRVT